MEEQAKVFFENYCKDYEIKKELDLMDTFSHKYYHTYRVVAMMKKLICALDLTLREKELAVVVAFFHDLGRFVQLEKCHVYDDSKSNFDHGLESVKILKECQWCKEQDLTDFETKAIFFAIENHNKFQLRNTTDALSLLLGQLLRDADKLVIMWEEVQKLTINPSGLSDLVEKQFLKQQLIDWDTIQTDIDSLVYYLAFLFDLNFNVSFNILKSEEIPNPYYHLLSLYGSNEICEKIRWCVEHFLKEKSV